MFLWRSKKEVSSCDLLEFLKRQNFSEPEFVALLGDSASPSHLVNNTLDPENGDKPLHVAIRNHHPLSVIAILLEHDPSATISFNADEETPMHLALSLIDIDGGKSLRLLKMISNSPQVMKKPNSHGQRPFQLLLSLIWQKVSCGTSNADMGLYFSVIQFLVEENRDNLILRDIQGNTIWHEVARIVSQASLSFSKDLLLYLVKMLKETEKLKPWQVANSLGETPRVWFLQNVNATSDSDEYRKRESTVANALKGWNEGNVQATTSTRSGTIVGGSRGAIVGQSNSMLLPNEESLRPMDFVTARHGMSSCDLSSISRSHLTSSSLSSTWKEVALANSPAMQLSNTILHALPSSMPCPYDVFLIHGGEQKEQVSMVVELLQMNGLRCFFDKKMKEADGSPRDQMCWALETCRYALVFVSKRSAVSRYPSAELEYAHQRAAWIRDHFTTPWRPMQVILYDLTVEEYSILRTDPNRQESITKLPELEADHVLHEWNTNGRESLPDLLHPVSLQIQEYDKMGAVGSWESFLTQYLSLVERGFPRARAVYKSGREVASYGRGS